jgi:hypothetical protein
LESWGVRVALGKGWKEHWDFMNGSQRWELMSVVSVCNEPDLQSLRTGTFTHTELNFVTFSKWGGVRRMLKATKMRSGLGHASNLF